MSLSYIDLVFEPAVCLWLIHLRGRVTTTIEGKSAKPWISHYWKRIVDWSLVATIFILSISKTAIITNAWMGFETHRIDYSQFTHYLLVDRRLNLAVIAFSLLLSIDSAISLIALKVTQRRAYFIDAITTRLVVAVLPFVVLRFIESLIFTIYPTTYRIPYIDPSVRILVTTILGGIFSIGVISGLASTMIIPHVLWAPGATTSTTALPVGHKDG
ncbi:hypothetical protein PIIN_10121 [Serendipita indica DSM 11827]|uniref:Uncharacterized protein n=1 Tax=Serendipita indica (strain DSM 11827) TaxID=1109443 RepID=G4TXS8_SERID|nr:hypothetical protein PIIN_10121 [Serendipita indica DSM 11827]